MPEIINTYFFIQIYLRITRERKEEERDVYTMICTIEKVVSLQPIICGVINKLGKLDKIRSSV